MILGLSRYGGLRTPSETLSLRWEDMDWEVNRISVPEPKVAHHYGRGIRSCPIFPELRPILDEAFEIFGGKELHADTGPWCDLPLPWEMLAGKPCAKTRILTASKIGCLLLLAQFVLFGAIQSIYLLTFDQDLAMVSFGLGAPISAGTISCMIGLPYAIICFAISCILSFVITRCMERRTKINSIKSSKDDHF